MLNSIKTFLFGEIPNSDHNQVFYQSTEPPSRAGLLQWNQRLKGDLWFDTTDSTYTAYFWDGKQWKLIPLPPVDA